MSQRFSSDGVPWRAAAIEGCALAAFIAAAVAITALVEYPASPVRHMLASDVARRACTGVAMGLTAATIIYSPWGRRSGAHLNPAVTLTFLRLGKIEPRAAAVYVAAQFAGGLAGVAVAWLTIRSIAAHPSVSYIATSPGWAGASGAVAVELAISFGLMLAVLTVSNRPRLSRHTGICAGCLVAIYILVESPLSGMSMNPARSFAPALASGLLGSLWIYFVAPTAGMLLAAETYVRRLGREAVRCAKFNHPANGPCHFKCGYMRNPG